MISRFYRGRLGIVDAMSLSIGDICILYNLALEESSTDEGKKTLEAEAMGEALLGG